MRRYEEELGTQTIPSTRVGGSGRVGVPGFGEVRISGSGYVSPEEIRVSGSGRLPGGLTVGRLISSGSVSVAGEIRAREVRLSGSAGVRGDVHAGSLRASGSFGAEGGASGGSMRFSGSAKIGKGIDIEGGLVAHGFLRAGGDVKAGSVELVGSFDIDGNITTETFTADLRRDRSHVEGSIRANVVDVRRGAGSGSPSFGERLLAYGLRMFGRGEEGELHARDIAGRESVHLENVICENVSGGEVTIGEGCKVRGRILYTGSLEVHPEAEVRSRPEKVESIG